MCQRCANDIQIPESQLEGLPFTRIKFGCVVEGCKGGRYVKDYGLTPYFFDTTKKEHGWFSALEHFYLCSKHWRIYKRNPNLLNWYILKWQKHTQIAKGLINM